ncbi:uncharacterized protein TRIADDRAFT_54968 [Trichoplax adhaerens]|uniref:BZIP domain-containing protein n=1 Tax=Trichoplax adhaerens TaxID=10228 RepID=B3RQF4_TRIAD|nr:hypothetical protein TRIADDRAFT_54968 [Trichoplax adhaerens]EDV26692.1 hypothetical protein TRIADDRAFT_54968 [Trichoplax adhaerens]|eukprot:XP_002110688.1 hypothetical protein TRIADDRAFT_54968 [Trichoplax adhaerens]
MEDVQDRSNEMLSQTTSSQGSNQQDLLTTATVSQHNNPVQRTANNIPIQNSGQVINAGILVQAGNLAPPQLPVQGVDQSEADDKATREMLARRPSYRKIYNDISDSNNGLPKIDMPDGSHHSQPPDGNDQVTSISMANNTTIVSHQQAGGPTDVMHPVGAHQNIAMQVTDSTPVNMPPHSIAAITVAPGQPIMQYTQQPQQAFQLRPPHHGLPHISHNLIMNNPNLANQQMAEEASRKRELRLRKNRDAAKECRRKKKEYVKCLENRVAVLENQNKALIEELKALKDLYCQKSD